MKRKELLGELKAGRDLTTEQLRLEAFKIALQATIHKIDFNRLRKDAKVIYDVMNQGFEEKPQS